MADIITIEFEGQPLAARAGESLAAALTAHGIRGLRRTRDGSERGLFCGMGVCQECLVEVDGRPNRRACMTRVDRPLVVRRQNHAAPLAPDATPQPPATIDDLAILRPELLVIGAGPGGLSAAIAACKAGADVLVVDERLSPGGQYFKPVAVEGADVSPPDAQHQEGLALVAEARAAGVAIRTGITVWGAFGPGDLAAHAADGGTLRLMPRATIIATGAYERGWPVPGWQLPGVMTTGAAQTLWRTARRLPGRRVLIAGNGPLNLQLAAELVAGGADVVALVEAAPHPVRGLASLAAMAMAAPGLVADGIAYHARRLRGGVPMLHEMVVGAVAAAEDGLAITLAPAGDPGVEIRRIVADVLCLGHGFEPSNELLRALGCRHDVDEQQRRLVTWRDVAGRTSVAGVYALGDCTAMGGARVAMADGVVTGLAAAADLGHAIPPALARSGRDAAARAARHRRFQQALWRVYQAPPQQMAAVADTTLLCRCEQISFGTARAVLAEGVGAGGPGAAGAIKRATRIGMGPCQGRYCRPLLEALIRETTGRPEAERSGFAPRPPVRPIAIRDLAAWTDK